MAKKVKSKVHQKVGKKPPSTKKPKNTSLNNKKSQQKQIGFSAWHIRYWLTMLLLVVAAVLSWQLSHSWLVRLPSMQAKTYPKVTVLGVNVGGLDDNQLGISLNKLKSDYEKRTVTLTNDKDIWTFESGKLGVTLDTKTIEQAIVRLNDLNFIDSYRLWTGQISSEITPSISSDINKCIETLSVINIPAVNPVEASIYFDQTVKIKPDQAGEKFSAGSTCQKLPDQLLANKWSNQVSFETVPAELTKANLEPKLPLIQSLVGESLTLKSGSFTQTLTPEQLLALLDIVKKGSDVQVSWSSARLDELVNGIASKINTYEGAALSGCQYLVSYGGNWLDKAAAKKILTNLGAGSPRTYTLPVSYHAPVTGVTNPVAHGNSGTIFLTFDDGMNYGNQIMNYAACYGVKVTFFEIGERVWTDAAALRRAVAEGHAVQSHGHYHAIYDYGQRSYDWQYNDIAQSITDIQSVTGVRPTYFRPPGGNRSANTYAAASANGVNLILWGASSSDTYYSSPSAICSQVLAGVFPGASVLMHSTKQSTANAVPCIIEGLAARGYNMAALR